MEDERSSWNFLFFKHNRVSSLFLAADGGKSVFSSLRAAGAARRSVFIPSATSCFHPFSGSDKAKLIDPWAEIGSSQQQQGLRGRQIRRGWKHSNGRNHKKKEASSNKQLRANMAAQNQTDSERSETFSARFTFLFKIRANSFYLHLPIKIFVKCVHSIQRQNVTKYIYSNTHSE